MRALISTAILGAALAAIIQMFRAPDGLPPAQTPNEAQAHADYQLAQTNAESSYPRVLPVTTAQVNNFLAARVISMAGADEPLYRPKFVRAFIIPGNGSLQFFIEEKLGNLTVYIQLVQSPVVSGNTVAFETVGGAIGRLPVHPKLMPLVQRVAGPIQASVGEALGTLKNISGVAINPTGIVVSWPGSAAAKTP